MKIYFVRDELKRINRMYATTEEGSAVFSDTFSYLSARKMNQEMGDVMGFDNPLEKITKRSELDTRDL